MDSNVSKNTFSHKFFKLRFVKDKSTISIKNWLKQELLQRFNLSQQLDVRANIQSIATILEQKIVLLSLDQTELLLKPGTKSIVYSCPIVPLAKCLRQPPQLFTKNLEDLLSLERNNSSEPRLNLQVEITSGWLNFYLDYKAVAHWLERSLMFIETTDPIDLLNPAAAYCLKKTSENIFPAQYIHARCCSLLRLGAREQLIGLKDTEFGSANWQIEQPRSIPWLDEEQLWLTELTEYNLLRQLFAVADFFASDFDNWLRLALNLSSTTAIFLADCRFLGEVKQTCLPKAIARLGLIALTQYWLQRILKEKLEVAAPKEL